MEGIKEYRLGLCMYTDFNTLYFVIEVLEILRVGVVQK